MNGFFRRLTSTTTGLMWAFCLSVLMAPTQASASPSNVTTATAASASQPTTGRLSPQAILEGADAYAAVAPSEDAVLRLLHERGLLPSPAPAAHLANQVKGKASDLAADLVISAMEFLGVPYRMGGNSASEGFDCSGFTRHIFEHSLGLILPRRAVEQANSAGLQRVEREDLKPGDLVFFNTLRRSFSHVGIYIGNDKFIHSPRAGGQVRVEDMRMAYWQKRFDGARRAPVIANTQMDVPPSGR